MEAWKVASLDLGINVIAPFSLSDRSGGFVCSAHLPEFGGANGMLVDVLGSDTEARTARAARALGMYLTRLAVESYSQYDRAVFVETLNDWGWCGSVEPPPWFTGASWS